MGKHSAEHGCSTATVHEAKRCKSCRFLYCRVIGKGDARQDFVLRFVFHIDVHRDHVGETFAEMLCKTFDCEWYGVVLQ